MQKAALLSPDRAYRYWLHRAWGPRLHNPLVIIGLNPSTADELSDDPTIRKCIGFAHRWDHDAILMANLFAFRATDPDAMKDYAAHFGKLAAVGTDNDYWLRLSATGKRVLCAWGNDGEYLDRAADVVKLIAPVAAELVCLGTTKTGQPKHPLYPKYETPRVPFVLAA